MATSPAAEGPSSRKVHRTKFSPWTKAILGKPPSAVSSPVAGPAAATTAPPTPVTPSPAEPEPSRIVSDVVLPSTEPPRPLSGFARIVAAQEQWEKTQSRPSARPQRKSSRTLRADSSSTDDSSGSSDLPAVTAATLRAQPAPPASTNPYIPSVPSMPVSTQKRRSSDVPTLHPDPKRARLPPSTQPSQAVERASARIAGVEKARSASSFELRQPSMRPSAQSPAPSPSERYRKPLTSAELVARTREEVRRSSASASPALPAVPPKTDAVMQSPTPPTPIAGEAVAPLERRADGHLYSTFGDETRKGALIPTGYTIRADNVLPYPCPVDDCYPSMGFESLSRLAYHFNGVHYGKHLHDNCDGTFSVISTYKNPKGMTSPALVVSRGPKHIPPSISRQLSGLSNSIQGAMPSPNTGASTPPKTETPVPLPSMPGQKNQELVSYLGTIFKDPLHREDIDGMLLLKKLRDLPSEFVEFYKGKSEGTEPSVYACAVAYMTGQEVTGPEKCTLKNPTSRLSEKCIALPNSLSPSAHKTFFQDGKSCVGCRYWSILQRRKVPCQWAKESLYATEKHQDSTDTDMEVPNGPEAVTTRSKLSRASSTRRSYGVVETLQPEYPVAAIRAEEWEFAPGKRESKKDGDIIAMAKSYLDNAQPFKVDEDISTHTITVKTGSRHHLLPEASLLRICHIMSGKADIRMEGEEPFRLGPGGMIKIKQDASCVMENRLYEDVKAFITAIDR